jgi:F-type H+-transporting ATPase subunit a
LDQLILALEECDFVNEPVCAPSDVSTLFVFEPMFGSVTRTHVLIFLAAFIVVGLVFFGLRKRQVLPGKLQYAVESLFGTVRNDIAIGIIGPEGLKFFPYLMSVFLFILVGNLFEITPLVNFPITSRMAIPAFLALLTYVIFVGVGVARHGISYFTHLAWPPSSAGAEALVGIIELVSVLLVRPFSLAVRLFANLVAGHTMLSTLLVTGWVFTSNAVTNFAEIGPKSLAGPAWFVFGLGIWLFELLVSFIQAYIFTLLSAVYIQSSLNIEHGDDHGDDHGQPLGIEAAASH